MWIAAAVATALAGGLGLIRYPYFVREPCRLLPVARADVRVGTSGFVAEVLAREGDVVEKHQVIARLRDDVLDAERSKVETEIRAMEARLEKALRGARPEEIDAARALMSTKAKAVEFAQRELGRQRNLFANGVGARAALDAAEKDVASAAAELREVRAEWALLSSALREEQIQIARVELERAKAQQAYLDARVERLVVRSPVKGTLVTPRFEESVDRRVAPGDVLCRVVDATKLEAELEIGEHDRDAVRTGLPAAVKIQSFPDRVFTGRVDFVAPSIESRGNLRYFRAVVTIDNEDGVLTDRMSGYAEIDTGSRPLIVLLLRRWLRRALVAWLI
jgi:multidrug resistance efflux pump